MPSPRGWEPLGLGVSVDLPGFGALPLESVKNLYLTTKDGCTLAIAPQKSPTKPPIFGAAAFFLSELPARPQVISSLDPWISGRLMTDPKTPIHLPKLLFARMRWVPKPGPSRASRTCPTATCPICKTAPWRSSPKQDHQNGGAFPRTTFSFRHHGRFVPVCGEAAFYFRSPPKGELKDKVLPMVAFRGLIRPR